MLWFYFYIEYKYNKHMFGSLQATKVKISNSICLFKFMFIIRYFNMPLIINLKYLTI